MNASKMTIDSRDWERLQKGALLLALVGSGLFVLLGCIFYFAGNVRQIFLSYLVAYTYWLGIGVGSLVLLMIQHLTGGAWGILIRRILESGSSTLWLLALFFLPLILGIPSLYLWAQPAYLEHDKELAHKSIYLNIPFFLVRTACYFLVWVLISHFLIKWSDKQDRHTGPRQERRFRLLSGPGLVLYGFTITFASIDWVMSLEPNWYSTIFPVMFAVGQVLTAFAFAIAIFLWLAGRSGFARSIRPEHLRDLGNLLMAFVLIWAYMSVSQFVLIWTGNLPEEIPWYVRRTQGGWQWIALLLVLFHFAVPFLLLLSREFKENTKRMGQVALLILAMRYVDFFWWIEPAYPRQGAYFFWTMDLTAATGLGGIWFWFFLSQLKKRPLLPLLDTEFAEVLHHG